MSNMFTDDGPDRRGTNPKIMLATVVYDSPDASYTFSIQKTREVMHAAGLSTAYVLLSGNCHVDDARNSIVQEFLLSNCTDLFFLDADVSWEPKDLIQICLRERGDIIGGVYPYRRQNHIEAMPYTADPMAGHPDEDGLLQVHGLPTGFMRIKRHVIEALAEDAVHFDRRGDKRSQIPILFERTFEDGLRWGGDLTFCNKARAKGFSIFADVEIRLGHTAKLIINDSLAACLRRTAGTTLAWMVDKVNSRTETAQVFVEARRAINNDFSALEDVLMICALAARQANGPIIETGSGLTSIVMAAATEQDVYVLEHDPLWAAQFEQMVAQAQLPRQNIKLCQCGFDYGQAWYDLSDFPDLPNHFALGLNDGPPRTIGARMGFFERFGKITDTIIVDDADDDIYAAKMEDWCASNSRAIDYTGERAAYIRFKELANAS